MHLAGRTALPCQDGGSLDSAVDCGRYDPCGFVPVQFGGADCREGGGGVADNRLEER